VFFVVIATIFLVEKSKMATFVTLCWPTSIIPMALYLDIVLLLSKSWIVTAIVGSMGFSRSSSFVAAEETVIPVEETFSICTCWGKCNKRQSQNASEA
jgi:hypothetical protein